MKSFLARGRQTVREFSAAAGPFQRWIPVDEADRWFTAGDLIFTANADGSDMRCHGTALQVTADRVTTLFASGAARAAGSLLWRPEHLFAWPVDESYPRRSELVTGVSVRDAAGGGVYATRVAEPHTRRVCRFDNLRAADASAFQRWLRDYAEGGLLPFYHVAERGGTRLVLLASARIVFLETSPERVRVEMELIVPGEGETDESLA